MVSEKGLYRIWRAIDTNLLVYLYDRRDPGRQAASVHTVGLLAQTGMGRLSAQCLSEFFSAVTKKKRDQEPILTVSEAIGETEKLARAFAIYPVTQQIVLEALRGVRRYHLFFWDAQIWAAARLNQVAVIFSQDFQPGADLEGVRFVNPFDPGFNLSDWAA